MTFTTVRHNNTKHFCRVDVILPLVDMRAIQETDTSLGRERREGGVGERIKMPSAPFVLVDGMSDALAADASLLPRYVRQSSGQGKALPLAMLVVRRPYALCRLQGHDRERSLRTKSGPLPSAGGTDSLPDSNCC